MRALWDYEATEPNEISFQVDQVFQLVAKHNEDWWEGRIDGKTGFFPQNHVTLIEGPPPTLPPTTDESIEFRKPAGVDIESDSSDDEAEPEPAPTPAQPELVQPPPPAVEPIVNSIVNVDVAAAPAPKPVIPGPPPSFAPPPPPPGPAPTPASPPAPSTPIESEPNTPSEEGPSKSTSTDSLSSAPKPEADVSVKKVLKKPVALPPGGPTPVTSNESSPAPPATPETTDAVPQPAAKPRKLPVALPTQPAAAPAAPVSSTTSTPDAAPVPAPASAPAPAPAAAAVTSEAPSPTVAKKPVKISSPFLQQKTEEKEPAPPPVKKTVGKLSQSQVSILLPVMGGGGASNNNAPAATNDVASAASTESLATSEESHSSEHLQKHAPESHSQEENQASQPTAARRAPAPAPPRPTSSALPPNWHSTVDAQGRTYYYNSITMETSWVAPAAAPAPAPPAPAAAPVAPAAAPAPAAFAATTDATAHQQGTSMTSMMSMTNPYAMGMQMKTGGGMGMGGMGYGMGYGMGGMAPMGGMGGMGVMGGGMGMAYSGGFSIPIPGSLSTPAGSAPTSIPPSTSIPAATTAVPPVPGQRPPLPTQPPPRKPLEQPPALPAATAKPQFAPVQSSMSTDDLTSDDHAPITPVVSTASSAAAASTMTQGFLIKKAVKVNGKKSGDRAWKQVFMQLYKGSLYVYRDNPNLASNVNSKREKIKPMAAIPVLDCHCRAEIHPKRNFIFSLVTNSGSEYLFEAVDEADREKWVNNIKEECEILRQQFGESGPPPPESKRKGSLKRASSAKSLNGFDPDVPTHSPPQRGSPVLIFGGKLIDHVKTPTGIPKIVTDCVTAVEKRGLLNQGIYRLSGNTTDIQRLKAAYNNNEIVNLDDPQWHDINCITGALKLYFRELADPLMTFEFYQMFIDACKISDYNERLIGIRRLVHALPEPNFKTLKYMTEHLVRVMNHAAENKMDGSNLAIVFGPTLLRAQVETPDMVYNFGYQNSVVEQLLLVNQWMFT